LINPGTTPLRCICEPLAPVSSTSNVFKLKIGVFISAMIKTYIDGFYYFLKIPSTINESAKIPKVSNNNSYLDAKNNVKISGGVE
jgi:hypothetical protein